MIHCPNFNLQVFSVAVLSFVLTLSAQEIAEDNEFLHYQNFVKPLETGVYEDEGILYVQVRIPFDKKVSKRDVRAKAIFTAYELIKKWAIEYSAPERDKEENAPEGVKFVKGMVAKYLPSWHFKDWAPQFSLREYPHSADDGYYVLGQSVVKAEVVKNIPKSFFRPLAADDWNVAIGQAIAAGVAKDGREAILGQFQAWDASKIFVEPRNAASKEYSGVCSSVDEYLSRSEFPELIRGAMTAIAGRPEETSFEDRPISVSVVTNMSISVLTNVCKSAETMTNSHDRIQNDAEIKLYGRSLNSTVREVAVSCEDDEIEQTVVTKIIEVRKLKVCRTVRKVYGTARFEELFVGGGRLSNSGMEATPLGSAAEKDFFSSKPVSQKIDTLMDALRENPGDKKLWNYLGKCLMSKQDLQGAVICFRNALRIDADYEFAIVNIAETYQMLGLKRLAIGLAAYARGVVTDRWCIDHAEKILKED